MWDASRAGLLMPCAKRHSVLVIVSTAQPINSNHRPCHWLPPFTYCAYPLAPIHVRPAYTCGLSARRRRAEGNCSRGVVCCTGPPGTPVAPKGRGIGLLHWPPGPHRSGTGGLLHRPSRDRNQLERVICCTGPPGTAVAPKGRERVVCCTGPQGPQSV